MTDKQIMAYSAVNGIDVYESQFLPYDETIKLCNIETRQEFSQLTGKKIEALVFENKLFVSKRVYESIKSTIN